MPSRASRVLKIDPAKQEVSQVGPDFDGDFKWLSGALAKDGCIYAPPHSFTRVLKINTATQSMSLIGGDFEGGEKWIGAVAANDGCIWCIPQKAKRVLKIDPIKQQATLVGESFDGGDTKWLLGALGDDGCIYGAPSDADRVLKIDPTTERVMTIGESLSGTNKWDCPARGVDGRLYCAPRSANQVLCIDVAAQSVYRVGPELSNMGNNMFNFGMCAAADGVLYALHKPQVSGHILRVSPPLFYLDQANAPPASFGLTLAKCDQLQPHALEHFSSVIGSAQAACEREEAITCVCRRLTDCIGLQDPAETASLLKNALALVKRDPSRHWLLLQALILALGELRPLFELLLAEDRAGTLNTVDIAHYLQAGDECPYAKEARALALHADGVHALECILEKPPDDIRAPVMPRLAVILLVDLLSAGIEESPATEPRLLEQLARTPLLLQHLCAACPAEEDQARCRASALCMKVAVHPTALEGSIEWVKSCLDVALQADRHYTIATRRRLRASRTSSTISPKLSRTAPNEVYCTTNAPST